MPSPGATPNFAPALEAFSRGFVSSQRESDENDRRAASILFEGAKAHPELFDSEVTRKHVEPLVGGVSPTTVVLASSCSRRPEGPRTYQVVDCHGEGEHPADALTSTMRRLAEQADGLEPPEHFRGSTAGRSWRRARRTGARLAQHFVGHLSDRVQGWSAGAR